MQSWRPQTSHIRSPKRPRGTNRSTETVWRSEDTVMLLRMVGSGSFESAAICRTVGHTLRQVKRELHRLGVSSRSYFDKPPAYTSYSEPKRIREYQRVRKETRGEAQRALRDMGAKHLGNWSCLAEGGWIGEDRRRSAQPGEGRPHHRRKVRKRLGAAWARRTKLYWDEHPMWLCSKCDCISYDMAATACAECGTPRDHATD